MAWAYASLVNAGGGPGRNCAALFSTQGGRLLRLVKTGAANFRGVSWEWPGWLPGTKGGGVAAEQLGGGLVCTRPEPLKAVAVLLLAPTFSVDVRTNVATSAPITRTMPMEVPTTNFFFISAFSFWLTHYS